MSVFSQTSFFKRRRLTIRSTTTIGRKKTSRGRTEEKEMPFAGMRTRSNKSKSRALTLHTSSLPSFTLSPSPYRQTDCQPPAHSHEGFCHTFCKYQHKLLGSLLSLLEDRQCSNNSRLKPRECDADVLSKEIPSSFNNVWQHHWAYILFLSLKFVLSFTYSLTLSSSLSHSSSLSFSRRACVWDAQEAEAEVRLKQRSVIFGGRRQTNSPIWFRQIVETSRPRRNENFWH